MTKLESELLFKKKKKKAKQINKQTNLDSNLALTET